MKIMRSIVVAVVAASALLNCPRAADAAQAPQPADCQATVKVAMTLTARFVTLPDAPDFAAKGQGELCYSIEGKSAKIKGESIPRLTYESDKPPAGLSALTVLVDEMPGTTPVVGWSNFPVVTLDHADVRVRAYESRAAEIKDGTSPIVDVVIPDIMLSTAPIAVEGEQVEGYVDGDSLEAKLVGRTVLPEADFADYDQWLSGQTVLLELAIEIENPYEKKTGEMKN